MKVQNIFFFIILRTGHRRFRLAPECAGWGVNTKAADGEQTQTEGGGSGGLLSTVTIEPR